MNCVLGRILRPQRACPICFQEHQFLRALSIVSIFWNHLRKAMSFLRCRCLGGNNMDTGTNIISMPSPLGHASMVPNCFADDFVEPQEDASCSPPALIYPVTLMLRLPPRLLGPVLDLPSQARKISC